MAAEAAHQPVDVGGRGAAQHRLGGSLHQQAQPGGGGLRVDHMHGNGAFECFSSLAGIFDRGAEVRGNQDGDHLLVTRSKLGKGLAEGFNAGGQGQGAPKVVAGAVRFVYPQVVGILDDLFTKLNKMGDHSNLFVPQVSLFRKVGGAVSEDASTRHSLIRWR